MCYQNQKKCAAHQCKANATAAAATTTATDTPCAINTSLHTMLIRSANIRSDYCSFISHSVLALNAFVLCAINSCTIAIELSICLCILVAGLVSMLWWIVCVWLKMFLTICVEAERFFSFFFFFFAAALFPLLLFENPPKCSSLNEIWFNWFTVHTLPLQSSYHVDPDTCCVVKVQMTSDPFTMHRAQRCDMSAARIPIDLRGNACVLSVIPSP